MAGIVIAPSEGARAIYLDSNGKTSFPIIDDNYKFDTSTKNLFLFGNNIDSNNFNGFVDMQNMMILTIQTNFFV